MFRVLIMFAIAAADRDRGGAAVRLIGRADHVGSSSSPAIGLWRTLEPRSGLDAAAGRTPAER